MILLPPVTRQTDDEGELSGEVEAYWSPVSLILSPSFSGPSLRKSGFCCSTRRNIYQKADMRQQDSNDSRFVVFDSRRDMVGLLG